MRPNNELNTTKTQSVDLTGGITLDNEQHPCEYCGGRTVLHGTRTNEHTVKQRFLCLDCKRTFTQDAEYGKLSVNPKVIALVLDRYFKGISLRKITDHLSQFYDLEVSHIAVHKWIQKYTAMINKYADTIKPKTGEVWHGDETMIKVGGQYHYLWNMLDEETRFLLTANLTLNRGTEEAKQFFQKSMKNGKPKVIITDSLGSYRKAYKKVVSKWWTRDVETKHAQLKGSRPQHIPFAGFIKKMNNNVIERYHGTTRERDKVMRGLKKEKTAKVMLDGFKNYYNLVREHSTLGTTPAQKAGISLNLGKNEWMGLLKRSVTSKIGL